MKPTSFFTIVILFIVAIIHNVTIEAQSNTEKPSLDQSNIENQFNYVYQQSSDFEDYKMVKRWWITRLKQHVLDSLKQVEDRLADSRNMVNSKTKEIDSLNNLLSASNTNLATALKEKNTLRFLGISMEKAAYNSIVWTIIVGLSISFVLILLLYRRGHSITKQTKDDLTELKNEFETFRKRALEREEGIVRKYHNELMQYKNKAGKV
jgi:hypothetical protein